MSKEEFLKIKTCVLKVNIHCDGCKQNVKKILQKIDGVYTTTIDSEQGKVTVSGNVDPATLIKKLTKNGKHAEIWGASKANNNNQNQMNNQFKNLQIDNGSKGGKNKGQAPKGGGNNNQPKGGPQVQNPQFQQQLQQFQQMKGLQDLKMPPQFMKDLRGANINKGQNQKSVKFNLPEDEGMSDDDFDDDDFDDYDDEDDFDDEVDDIPVVHNKMKPPMLVNGHGGAQMDNIMMNNVMNGHHPQLMKGGGNNGGNGGENGKKGGGGGGGPAQMNLGGGNQNQSGANGGKKGGNGNNNGGNQNQGGGKGGKNGGGQANGGKNGGGGPVAVNGSNGAKKGGGMNDGPHGMPNMMAMSAEGKVGQMATNMPMGQMGIIPMGQMNNLAAVQGHPALPGSGGGAAGYFPAATPDHMPPNPYYQQQLAAMMMNQQRANGNDRFQPMMYARPPPAVNYMPPYPPYPYPYPYAPPQGERTDQYTMFSDENTSSCNVM